MTNDHSPTTVTHAALHQRVTDVPESDTVVTTVIV
jgi:hypothetical protein